MDKTFYVVIAGAPGSLLDEPPSQPPVVYFDERAGEEDGRSWVYAHDGVKSRYHKQHHALIAAGYIGVPADE